MYTNMKNLINAKYYEKKEEAEYKSSVFFAFNVITEEEYSELMLLIADKYTEVE